MAFPLMALGAGLGIAADDINKQRAQQAQLQMQQMRFAREMQMLKLALDQKNQTQQASLSLGALDPSAAIRGDAGATSLPAAPGANNSPYVGSAGGFNLSTEGAPQGAASPTFGSNAFEPMTAMPSPSGGGGNWETQHNNFAGMRIPGVVAGPNAGGFQSFATPEAGIQGISRQLDRYASGATTGTPLTTLRQIVSTWAPPSENPTDQLISRASRVMGVPPDQPLDLANPQVKGKLVEAMIRGEQGGRLPIDPGVIQRALGGAAQPETQVAQAGPQTATDAGPQTPQLPPPPDLIGIRQRAVQQVGAIPGLTPQQREAYANSVVNLAKSQWEVQKQQVEFQATQQNRASEAATRGLHFVTMPDGTTKEWHPGQPIPPGARVGAVGGPATGGKPGTPHNIEVRDAEGKAVYTGAARMTPEGFAKPDGSLIQIPEGGSASMAGTGAGRQAATQIQAIIGSGNELLGELNNLMELPKTATLGIFQGLQNMPASELSGAMRRSLANKFTPEEQTDLNTSFQGVARALATIEAQGRATGLVGLTEQARAMAPQSGDTIGNVLRKYATLRQILERGLETVQANRDISPDQKALMQKMLDEVKQVVPFTVSEVNKMQHGDVESLRAAATAMGFGGQQGAPGGGGAPQEGDIATAPGQPTLVYRGGKWVPQ